MYAIGIPLSDLFYDNAALQHEVEHKLDITTLEELLFFSERMVIRKLGHGTLHYIKRRLHSEGFTGNGMLRLRRNHETYLEYAMSVYATKENTPIIALNFTKEGRKDKHEVLRVVRFIDTVQPGAKFSHLGAILEFGHDDAMPAADIEAFEAQLREWEVSL